MNIDEERKYLGKNTCLTWFGESGPSLGNLNKIYYEKQKTKAEFPSLAKDNPLHAKFQVRTCKTFF